MPKLDHLEEVKSRNKVSVGEPTEGSLPNIYALCLGRSFLICDAGNYSLSRLWSLPPLSASLSLSLSGGTRVGISWSWMRRDLHVLLISKALKVWQNVLYIILRMRFSKESL
jgi:hypothetical protein